MSDMEKAKRKAKPHERIRWRRVIVRAITISLTLLVVFFAFILVFPACGCSPGTFSRDSTQIAATNQDVAIQIEQTNTAIVQLSTEVALTNQAVATQIQLTNTAIVQLSTKITATNQAIATKIALANTALTQATPEPASTMCFHAWQDVADTNAAEQLSDHLAATGMTAQQVYVRHIIVSEDWTCVQGELEQPVVFDGSQTWVGITLDKARQTNTEQLGELVAITAQVMRQTALNPAKQRIYLQVNGAAWQNTYAELNAALEAGTHGAELWAIGQ